MQYAVAHRLIGFRSSSLRVRIVEQLSNGDFNVVTADLLDAGTPLTLSASQVEGEALVTVTRHRDGLVAFA
jgi:hypothetical protein